MNTKYQIGEFAELGGVSTKTLRFYDESDSCGRRVLIRARDIACIRLNNSKSWLRFSP